MKAADWLGRHRGIAGLTTGLLAGIAVTALSTVYLQPILADSGGPEPGALVIMSGHDDSAGQQRHVLIDQWNQLHKTNPVQIIELSAVADAQRSAMLSSAQAGGRQVDIYNLDVTLVAEFASGRYIRRLDTDRLDLSGFLDNPIRTCRDGDAVWCLPFNSDAGLLFYRTDLVSRPPTSWSQLAESAAAALDRPAGQRPKAGYTGQLADYEGLTVNAIEAIWAAGGEVVDDQGRIAIDSEAARTGLARLARGLKGGSQPLVLPESTGFHEAESTHAFADKQVVFMRNWPVAYRTLDPSASADGSARCATGSDTGPKKVPFAVTLLPGPSVLGGQNLAVAARSRHPRAAQQLIEFLTSERSQQILFERGGFAATREIVYRDSAVTERYGYAQTLLAAIQEARPRPVRPRYAQFSKTFRAIVREALANGGDLPPDAVTRLERARQGYLD